MKLVYHPLKEFNKLVFLLAGLFCLSTLYAQPALQQPSMIVFPSDNQLQRLNCLDTVNQDGITRYVQRYQEAFVKDASLKFIINDINSRFAEVGFPLIDLEQSLKDINQEQFEDLINGKGMDARNALIYSVKPDIYLEITYKLKRGGMGDQLTFVIAAKDAYTNKTVYSISSPGEDATGVIIEEFMAEQVENNIANFQSGLQKHFNQVSKGGREIVIRVTIADDAITQFSDWSDACDDELSYVIHDWVKGKAREWFQEGKTDGTFSKDNRQSNTELRYNLNIPLRDEDGFGIGAPEIAREFRRFLRKNCELRSRDLTSGIGEVQVMLTD